ncbi:MAG TPA: AbrB/MazE/SpoVT family DNA-binding domain-containing protein [Thermomicrobiales bacterium]|nr:AbrB/MazE/SpoVT family DNA-binding domain-containing protein [Thermomicrobiales bacterium]
MTRKVFRSGNSLVVALPSDMVGKLALADGAEVDIDLDEDGRRIVVTPVNTVDAGVSPEYARQVAEFISTYRPALEALSQR